MGGGRWDSNTYSSMSTTRAMTASSLGVDAKTIDFGYNEEAKITQKLHPSLDPSRIKGKPFGKLESRDTEESPESTPVLISLDVTGSNYARAFDAQKELPRLMEQLTLILKDPQVAIAANDDFYFTGKNSLQISDFEADIRVDEHLRNLWLTRQGGGNDGESYDLVLYAAAYKTILDSVIKRGKKGYLFLYADEPIFTTVRRSQIRSIFGDELEARIPIQQVIADAQKLYNVYVIWPLTGFNHARTQYIDLFGEDFVLDLESPKMIVEIITSTVKRREAELEAQREQAYLVAGNSLDGDRV